MRSLLLSFVVLASTFSAGQYSETTNYRLRKPVTGVVNWGPYYNGDMDIIDAALFNLAPQSVGGVMYADRFPGIDIGARINAAYAALPYSGGKIIVTPTPDGSCWDFSTPIVAATEGKYLLLEGEGSGATGLTTSGGCLNYLPKSGAAITLDYVTNATSNMSAAHGLRNITLRNGCQQTGCYSGTAVGVLVGTTYQGILGASMDDVAIVGFPIGFQDLNNTAVQISWYNPQFFANDTAMLLKSITGFWIYGGQIAGNRRGIVGYDNASTSEMLFFGAEFFGNTALSLDFTALNGNSSYATLDCFGCHFENSNGVAHIIDGAINMNLFGGVMEDDYGPYSSDWMINATGQRVNIDGMRLYVGPGSTQATVLVANNPVVGKFAAFDGSPGHFTNYVTGANASSVSVQMDGSFTPTRIVSSGTATLTSGSVTTNTCQAAVTVSATGTLTTDSVKWSYATAPGSADALMHLSPYVTANNVSFTRCNATSASQTGTAIVVNWQVTR